jgi:hypothetical protein
MAEYNGWKNYKTWNVALWLSGDEGLYHMALKAGSYKAVVENLRELGITETPDHVAYNDSDLDLEALEEMMTELVGK